MFTYRSNFRYKISINLYPFIPNLVWSLRVWCVSVGHTLKSDCILFIYNNVITRDWNEELQTTRELPRKNLPERLLRERAIFKVSNYLIKQKIKFQDFYNLSFSRFILTLCPQLLVELWQSLTVEITTFSICKLINCFLLIDGLTW